MTWKEKIKEIRRLKDFTQEALAIQLDCDRSAISKWENGERIPEKRYKEKIDDLYFSITNKQIIMDI